jgi:hypothetical protein
MGRKLAQLRIVDVGERAGSFVSDEGSEEDVLDFPHFAKVYEPRDSFRVGIADELD